jgi:hypothetical protein
MTIALGMLDIMTTTMVHTLAITVATTTTMEMTALDQETTTAPGIKLTHGMNHGQTRLALSMLTAKVKQLNAALLF